MRMLLLMLMILTRHSDARIILVHPVERSDRLNASDPKSLLCGNSVRKITSKKLPNDKAQGGGRHHFSSCRPARLATSATTRRSPETASRTMKVVSIHYCFFVRWDGSTLFAAASVIERATKPKQ